MYSPEAPRVKCYSLINLQGSTNLVSVVAQNPIFHQDMLNEGETLFKTLQAYQNSQKTQQNLQKIYSHSGVWYCTIKQQIAIGLLTSTNYPVSGAMRLLRKIEQLIKNKVSPMNTKELQMLEPNIREVQILRKIYLNDYDKDPNTDDVLELTAKSVDSIQGQMEDNIRKIQENHQVLEVVHHKSSEVAQVANQFQKQAKDVRQKSQYHQWIIIGLMGLAAAGVTIYFIYKIF